MNTRKRLPCCHYVLFAAIAALAASCQTADPRATRNQNDPAIAKEVGNLATVTWSADANGLSLGVSVEGPVVSLYLKNVSASQLDVLSHVDASEVHLDWYRIFLTDASGNTRTLNLSDAREESAPVKVSLAPGGNIKHDVAVRDWAARSVNGGQPLAPGSYTVRATYEVKSQNGVWNGRLEAGPVTLLLR